MMTNGNNPLNGRCLHQHFIYCPGEDRQTPLKAFLVKHKLLRAQQNIAQSHFQTILLVEWRGVQQKKKKNI